MKDTKTDRMFVRLTPGDKDKVQAAADKVGMSTSDFTRALIVKGAEAVLVTDEDTFYKGIEARFMVIARLINAKFQAKRADEELQTFLE